MDITDLKTLAQRLATELGHYLTGSPNSRLRQMEMLRCLDDRQLADIGLKPEDVRLVETGLFDAPSGARNDFARTPDFARF